MAKQMSIIPFTGKLGNLIGYRRNGEYFFRSMPEIVRQNTATRRAARRFGIASRRAALIRNTFYSELDFHCDNGHINRLNKALIAAGDDHTAITGFRFNQHAGIDRFFGIPPQLFSNEVLHIPAQSLAQYKDIIALEVKVIANRIDFLTQQVTGTGTTTLTIDPRSFFEGTDIALDVPGHGTLVVAMQVRGMYKDGATGNRQYLAADIVAVTIPRIPKRLYKQTYPKQAILRQITPALTPAHASRTVVQLE